MKYLLFFTYIFGSIVAFSQVNFTPEQFLGYKVGAQFTRQDKVVAYFNALQKAFPSTIKVQKYGETYEKRDLIMAYIGTEENLKNIETIQKAHLQNDASEKIAIVWLSYNVHGNESSGTEAAMQTAYLLLTSKKDYLKNTIVIMDPCLNPDGRDRYVNFYYQYGNQPYDSHKFSAEHNEPWPSGRPNHYLFDLNRDWAWMTQVESQQRVKQYNKWLPHVHVDFHEQGINEPYYFPPAAEPYHEVITNWQRDFQKEIGKNHASYFDKSGWLYFSKEIFDLLYPSYGDTYPTYNGSIGMTYEQGGSGRAGLSVITQVGDTLTLNDRVSHHVTTGLSTVEMSALKADKLIKEYQDFCKKKNYKYKTYVLSGEANKLSPLLELLDKNEIQYEAANDASVVKGFHFKNGKVESYKTIAGDILVSTDQLKGTLVNVLFEPNTKLSDSLTYDITAWSLPYAYGINAIASEAKLSGKKYEKAKADTFYSVSTYGYLCAWNSMKSAKFLAALQKVNVKVYFSEKSFSTEGKNYAPGTLILLRGENKNIDFLDVVNRIAQKCGVELTPVKSGFVDSGSDFGAYSMKNIPKQSIGILAGKSTSSLSSGEIWHFFEQQLNYPAHLIFEEDLSAALSSLTTLFIPEGYYDLANNEELKAWINNGGKLIVMGGAASSFVDNEAFGLSYKVKDSAVTPSSVAFGNIERSQISNVITGAIYPCTLDATHPLAFGYSDYFSLRMTADAYKLNQGEVFKIKKEASPVNGFVGSNVKKKQSEAMVAGVYSMGKGSVVYLIDNPLFRAFWENGKLMVVNALFFVNL